MELIDKAAVIAEIERRHENLVRTMNKLYYASNYNEWKAVVNEYRSLMCYVNTLEVKEVDLENGSNPSYKEALNFIEDNTQVRYYEDRDSEGFRRGLDLEKRILCKAKHC